MEAPKIYMTVTAFRGCLLLSTWPIQEENGRTPSRATAKMRREAATIATLVLCVWVNGGAVEIWKRIHQDKTQYCDNCHEDTRALAQCHGVYLYEGLGGVQGKKSVQIWSAEEEENGSEESHDTGGQCAGQDPPGSDDTTIRYQREVRKGRKGLDVPGITGFFRDVTGSIETDHGSGCE